MTDRLVPATPARLNTWLDCPAMFRFRYVDRPSPGRRPPTAERSWGNTIHLALRAWYDLPAQRRTPDEGARLVAAHWVAAGWRDAAQQDVWRARAADVVRTYLTAVDPVAEPAGLERTVAATYGGMAVSGRVDRIDLRDSELVVVDYKSGARPPGEGDVRGSLALALYAYAAWRTLRRRCLTVELHHVPSGIVVAYRHTEDGLRRHLDRAAGVAREAAAATQFPARPSGLCGWCDYLPLCPAGLEHEGGVLREPWESIERRETES